MDTNPCFTYKTLRKEQNMGIFTGLVVFAGVTAFVMPFMRMGSQCSRQEEKALRRIYNNKNGNKEENMSTDNSH